MLAGDFQVGTKKALDNNSKLYREITDTGKGHKQVNITANISVLLVCNSSCLPINFKGKCKNIINLLVDVQCIVCENNNVKEEAQRYKGVEYLDSIGTVLFKQGSYTFKMPIVSDKMIIKK